MIDVATKQGVITYTKLVEKISSITLEPRDLQLAFLLDEISREENMAGDGMLTVVVVHKHDMQPGEGFFKLAKQLGRNVTCKDTFWANEIGRVHRRWKK